MTRTRFNGLCRALADKIQHKYNGQHIDGSILRFYRDREHTLQAMQAIARKNGAGCEYKSYQEAWEALKPARDCVGM